MLDILGDLLFDAAEDVSDAAEDLECNDFDGVEDGTFDGDEDDLEELAEAGMVEGTEHIPADDIVRNIAARDEFLSILGYDEVPDGMQVHHILPISEGGTDDISNMVLLTEEEHAKITQAHRDFYKWNK